VTSALRLNGCRRTREQSLPRHPLFDFVDRRRLRTPDDIERHGLVGVAAEARTSRVQSPSLSSADMLRTAPTYLEERTARIFGWDGLGVRGESLYTRGNSWFQNDVRQKAGYGLL
jgi:hypothetical protein